MNHAYFSSVARRVLIEGREEICLLYKDLIDLTRTVFGIAAVDRLYPLKPKNPI
ncbi:hypothetical protein LV84_04147 [Algoriphagus ratkowskyi]|uniref:Uncharacterized protein n=1 Tax=Algoriphagus ratkowskyi TaxID=57028 RepID=A0A2W7R1Z7_9BACT|nr:hypothetical protein LV84_04147 [Algoriphagus ratkowskyi]